MLQEYNGHIGRETAAPECVRGITYRRPGLADGHQTGEEVFVLQLAEHMGVIGYRNGDFFHHLASWPVHSSSCCPAPDQAVQGKILLRLSANAHTHLSLRGWSVKDPERIRAGKKRRLPLACLAIHPQQKTQGGRLSVEEVYTVNTCTLNTEAGKFTFSKSSLNFKEEKSRKVS